jgi:WD40 repeat protein
VVAFSPDGRYVAIGTGDISTGSLEAPTWLKDNTFRVLEANTGKEIWRYTRTGPVGVAVFSPDGQYVATGADNIARVLDTDTGQEVSELSFNGPVTTVAFSLDGHYLFTPY